MTGLGTDKLEFAVQYTIDGKRWMPLCKSIETRVR